MHIHHLSKISGAEILEPTWVVDPRVVHHGVERPEDADRLVDDRSGSLLVCDIGSARHRVTAGIADLGSDFLGGAIGVSAPVHPHPVVGHDYPSTSCGELEGVGSADAPAGAGYSNHTIVEAQLARH